MIAATQATTASALSIRGLCKVYPGNFEALKNIDLDVAEGDFFALLGPNGAGKSTTIGIVGSLITRTAGSVHIAGIDTAVDFNRARRHLGLMAQELNLNQFERVLDVVTEQGGYFGMPRAEAHASALSLLNRLGLADHCKDKILTLSGGMKRRLMIAKAMVHNPRILILDEPTAGVDVETRHEMWAFLQRINNRGTTIILTTHYLEEAESLCKNIAIIDQGSLIENTSMRELLQKLDTETILLHLDRPLNAAPDVPEPLCQLIEPQVLQVSLNRGQTLNPVITALSKVGAGVSSIRNQANRLEQVFMNRLSGERH